MSSFETDVPKVVIKPGKMLNYWPLKVKVLVALLALGCYVYFLIFIKTIYLKSQKLDSLKAMASDTERMMNNLHLVDMKLAMNIERLNAMYDSD